MPSLPQSHPKFLRCTEARRAQRRGAQKEGRAELPIFVRRRENDAPVR